MTSPSSNEPRSPSRPEPAAASRSHRAHLALVPPTESTRVGDRLRREWGRLRARPDLVAQARTWGLTDGEVGDLDDVLAAVGHQRASSARTEVALRRLVDIAAHDDLAARTVLQRIVPGLLAVTRRRGAAHGTFDELVGNAWIAIRTFGARRDPSSVAAALIDDAEYLTYRRHLRRRSADELVVDLRTHDAPAAGGPSPADELFALLVEARRVGSLHDDELELVRLLLTERHALDVADRLSVTTRTVRNRRDRVVAQLRALADAA